MQDTEQNLLSLFSLSELRCKHYERFIQTELGQLYLTIPFQSLVSCFPSQDGKPGPKGRFDVAGGIALQILKSYYNDMSAEKLIARINTDWVLQRFCGIRLRYRSTEKASKSMMQMWCTDGVASWENIWI